MTPSVLSSAEGFGLDNLLTSSLISDERKFACTTPSLRQNDKMRNTI
jgi:hypothetical protein